MRRVTWTLLALVVCAAVVTLAPQHGALARAPQAVSHQDFPPIPGGTPVVIGLPNLNPPTATAVPPSGTPKSPTKTNPPPDAVRLALTNGYVKALLKGKAYRIQHVASWLAGKGRLVVAGFYHATTVSGTWMSVGKPPYRATYHRVSGVNIYVSLAHRAVVGIVPTMKSK